VSFKYLRFVVHVEHPEWGAGCVVEDSGDDRDRDHDDYVMIAIARGWTVVRLSALTDAPAPVGKVAGYQRLAAWALAARHVIALDGGGDELLSTLEATLASARRAARLEEAQA